MAAAGRGKAGLQVYGHFWGPGWSQNALPELKRQMLSASQTAQLQSCAVKFALQSGDHTREMPPLHKPETGLGAGDSGRSLQELSRPSEG